MLVFMRFFIARNGRVILFPLLAFLLDTKKAALLRRVIKLLLMEKLYDVMA